MSLLFSGEYDRSLDPKGRIIFPRDFWDELKGGFIITKGLDGCLYLYPNSEWHVFIENLRAQKDTIYKEVRDFRRRFVGSAKSGDLDKQGRFLIPGELREYACLGNDIVLVGMLERIEIWDKERWDNNNAIIEENMDEIAIKLQALGASI